MLSKSIELYWRVVVSLFVVATLPAYVIQSLSGDVISDDARIWTWPHWTIADRSGIAPDFFSQYILAQTPWAFRHMVDAFVGAGVTPDIVFSTLGIVCFLICAVLAFISGRSVGGAQVAWAALALVFAIGGVAGGTAGGFPRATGLATIFLGVYGFLSGRSVATGIASVVGALLWYPAAIVCGVLFAVQILWGKFFFDAASAKPLSARIAMVALIGALTIVPMLPALVGNQYGELIIQGDQAWPEAGRGGRYSDGNALGAPEDKKVWLKITAKLLSNVDASWLPATPFWNRVAKLTSVVATLTTVLVLSLLAKRDFVARRLLALFLIGAALSAVAIVMVPAMYVPTRYVGCVWLAAVVVATPYAAFRYGHAFPVGLRGLRHGSLVLAGSILSIVFVGAGRLTTQGLSVRPNVAERQLLEFAAQSPAHSVFAGWPNGVVENVPYFSRRTAFLTYELHQAFHLNVAREARARAIALIDAWYAKTPQGMVDLRHRYGVDYFIIDKSLIGSAAYFKPFDGRIRAMREALGGDTPYVVHPDRQSVVFENSNYVVLSLRKVDDVQQATSTMFRRKV